MSVPTSIPQDFKTPLEMFYHWEAEVPEKTWLRQPLVQGWRDYSWREVGAHCRRVAAQLRNMGLSDGDKVGIYAANSAHWIMADLAIMMAGMTSVPIYPTMPADKIRYVMEHSDMTAVFADSSVLPVDQLRNILPEGMPILALDDACAAGADAGWDSIVQTAVPLAGNPLRDRDDLWTIAYTSGCPSFKYNRAVILAIHCYRHQDSIIPYRSCRPPTSGTGDIRPNGRINPRSPPVAGASGVAYFC